MGNANCRCLDACYTTVSTGNPRSRRNSNLYIAREDARRRKCQVDGTTTKVYNKRIEEGDTKGVDDYQRRYTNSFKAVSYHQLLVLSAAVDIQLQAYAETDSSLICRHIAIARYFEEDNIDDKNVEHIKAYCDKMCDVSIDREHWPALPC